jgi:predicted transcriptional regulator
MSVELLHIDFTNAAIGDCIKSLDEADGLTVKTMAEFADLSPSMIYQVMTGEKRMAAGNFVKLARRLAELGNFRLIDSLLLPAAVKMAPTGMTMPETPVNGRLDDEVVDMVKAMSKAVHAYETGSAKAFLGVLEEVQTVMTRFEAEGRLLK